MSCSVTPNALWRRCSHVESRRANCSNSPAVWPEIGLGETTTWPAPYANWYANQPDSGSVRGCTPMYVKRSDLQKLDTHEHRRTPCLNLGVKWSQVQILSARPLKWPLSCEDGTVARSSYVAVEKVTVESTSDHWRIWYYLLEAAGLDVQLVNARDVKNVPGRRKTDKLDAVWLAKLTEKGLLRPSFVPPAADPTAARLHPAAGRSHPGTRPVLAAAGKAARRRADQVVLGGVHAGHAVGARRRSGCTWPARPAAANGLGLS